MILLLLSVLRFPLSSWLFTQIITFVLAGCDIVHNWLVADYLRMCFGSWGRNLLYVCSSVLLCNFMPYEILVVQAESCKVFVAEFRSHTTGWYKSSPCSWDLALQSSCSTLVASDWVWYLFWPGSILTVFRNSDLCKLIVSAPVVAYYYCSLMCIWYQGRSSDKLLVLSYWSLWIHTSG